MMQSTPLSVLISNNVEMLLSGDVGSFQLRTFCGDCVHCVNIMSPVSV